MQLGPSSCAKIPDGLMAAITLRNEKPQSGQNPSLGQKPHQGVLSKNAALHPGFGLAISNTALGMRPVLYDEGVGSCYTNKERDTESGLDYFEARYFGSSMGRFMSPDYEDEDDGPVSIPYYNPSNPQSLNLYSYVHNNPITSADADGHDCVVQTRVDDHHETVSVSTGTCAGVKTGSGQSATYVPGTVTSITANGGNSIDIGYNSYDGQSSGVVNAKGAPAFDHPGIDGAANAAIFGQIGNNGMGAIKYFAIGSVIGGTIGGAALATGVIGGGAGLTTLGDLSSGLTEHGAARLAQRGITPEQARAAVEAAKKAGDVVSKMGKYGTPQSIYTANGIRVVVEEAGANAGKIITAFFK